MTQVFYPKCPKPAGYLMTPSGKIPVNCNKWTCPYCSELKLIRLSNRIVFGFDTQGDLYMITLTQRKDSQRNILKDWQALKQRIERRTGEKLKYFWVKEKQKNGQRHLHILTDQGIDWRWLKDSYAEITHGESFHVYISEKPVKHAFGYALKYLGKDLSSNFMWKSKERKFGFSRHPRFKITGDNPNFERYNYFLGDFWQIIAHPHNTFVRLSEQEGISFMEDYIDDTGLLAGPI